MEIESFSRVCNEIRNCNDVLIIFIFESQAGVWSRVELRHEFGPLYRFNIHNLLSYRLSRNTMFNYILAGSVHEYREFFPSAQ